MARKTRSGILSDDCHCMQAHDIKSYYFVCRNISKSFGLNSHAIEMIQRLSVCLVANGRAPGGMGLGGWLAEVSTNWPRRGAKLLYMRFWCRYGISLISECYKPSSQYDIHVISSSPTFSVPTKNNGRQPSCTSTSTGKEYIVDSRHATVGAFYNIQECELHSAAPKWTYVKWAHLTINYIESGHGPRALYGAVRLHSLLTPRHSHTTHIPYVPMMGMQEIHVGRQTDK